MPFPFSFLLPLIEVFVEASRRERPLDEDSTVVLVASSIVFVKEEEEVQQWQ